MSDTHNVSIAPEPVLNVQPYEDHVHSPPPPHQRQESAGWLPAVGNDNNNHNNNNGNGHDHHRTTSVLRRKSLTTGSRSRGSSPTRSASVRSSARTAPLNGTSSSHGRASSLGGGGYAASVGRRSTFTNTDGRSIGGSTFINGASLTGPGSVAEPDEALRLRREQADASLSKKQKSKIVKKEAKDGRRLSKIIHTEGKVEKEALGVAVKELGELQKIQQAAVKRESKAHTSYSAAQVEFQKAETAFLAARSKYETSQAHMNALADTLDITRSNAREATEMMQEKSQEVDALTQLFGVDERERAVKLNEMKSKGVKTSTGVGRIFGR